MTLKEFQLAHRRYCERFNSKCGNKRNMKSKECMACALKYLDAQAGLEQYDAKARVSNEAPKFATLSDAAVRKGLVDLVNKIRSGKGEMILPVGARPVISGVPFEVVDHDTVTVPGLDHTMTLRFLMRDYEERTFAPRSGEDGVAGWVSSGLREYLNGPFLGKLSAPLREVLVAPIFKTMTAADDDMKLVETQDLVWIPSPSQLGFTTEDDIEEGDVLDAFDRELTIDSNARRMVVEYHGDEAVPKRYWLRSMVEDQNEVDDTKGEYTIKNTLCNHMGKLEFDGTLDATAMVVPMITIG